MAKTFADYEDRTRRSKVADVKFVKIFSRVYNVPPLALGLVPEKGTIMPGHVVKDGEDELFVPRVKNVRYGKQRSGAGQEVVLTIVEPQPFE